MENGSPIAPPLLAGIADRTATGREKGSRKKGLSFLMANEESEARLSDPPPSQPAPTDDGLAKSQVRGIVRSSGPLSPPDLDTQLDRFRVGVRILPLRA